VQGKVYNIRPFLNWANDRSHSDVYVRSPMPDWEAMPSELVQGLIFTAQVAQVLPQGLILQETKFNAFTFSSQTGGISQFLTNYPGASNLVDGQEVKFVAKRIGSYKYGDETIPAYDCGKPWTPPPPSTAEIKAAAEKVAAKKAENAAKALKYNQELAAAGDVYGQVRMGERYRDGDGVPKDLRLSREWFSKAAAQGDKNAALELQKLPHNDPLIHSYLHRIKIIGFSLQIPPFQPLSNRFDRGNGDPLSLHRAKIWRITSSMGTSRMSISLTGTRSSSSLQTVMTESRLTLSWI